MIILKFIPLLIIYLILSWPIIFLFLILFKSIGLVISLFLVTTLSVLFTCFCEEIFMALQRVRANEELLDGKLLYFAKKIICLLSLNNSNDVRDVRVYLSTTTNNLIVLKTLNKKMIIIVGQELNNRLTDDEMFALMHLKIMLANDFKRTINFYHRWPVLSVPYLFKNFFSHLIIAILDRISFKGLSNLFRKIGIMFFLFFKILYYPKNKIIEHFFSCEKNTKKHLEQFKLLYGEDAAHNLTLAIAKLSCFNKSYSITNGNKEINLFQQLFQQSDKDLWLLQSLLQNLRISSRIHSA
ncbi:MAG: hypothetical protein HQK49_02385 [Oligoflexia bacterium]|nr:hypothetical protein [Oligoflexia bacterium]